MLAAVGAIVRPEPEPTLDISIDSILTFIEAHHEWAGVVFGLMAFGESLAFIGVLIPATTVMIAAGTLVGTGVLPFFDVFVGGTIGAVLGDAISFWVGRWLGPRAHDIWPFRRHPELLAAGERVFSRWGWAAVFFGRFIGPLRASVPLAAGILAMPHWPFQFFNTLSAVAWIPVLVAPGAAASVVYQLVGEGHVWEAGTIGVLLLVGLATAWWLIRRKAPSLARGEQDETNGR